MISTVHAVRNSNKTNKRNKSGNFTNYTAVKMFLLSFQHTFPYWKINRTYNSSTGKPCPKYTQHKKLRHNVKRKNMECKAKFISHILLIFKSQMYSHVNPFLFIYLPQTF